MGLRICRYVDLPVPERMTGACRDSDLPKSPSELVYQSGAHALNLPELLITTLDEQTDG